MDCQYKRLLIIIQTQSMIDYERVLHSNTDQTDLNVPFCKWGLSLFKNAFKISFSV